jgi:hypothetical protein
VLGNELYVKTALEHMRARMINDAKTILGQTLGHGKYTSINMRGQYIEFRSMGGVNYFNNPQSLALVTDTIKRYVYAMTIAADDNLFRREYATKLYKLLDRTINNDTARREFANYVTSIGGADQQTVKNFIASLRQTQTNRPVALPDRASKLKNGQQANLF